MSSSFFSCFKRFHESSPHRIESLLLATCLLPANHSATLIFLARFFASVADRSEENKMDWTNLAIVLAPTLFFMEQSGGGSEVGSGGSKSTNTTPSAKKKMGTTSAGCGVLGATSSEDLALKTEVVKSLFQNANKVSNI